VGLGNPTALYTLVLFTGLSMRPGFLQSLGGMPQTPGMNVPDTRAMVVRKPARQ
jgi:hypothetical protein